MRVDRYTQYGLLMMMAIGFDGARNGLCAVMRFTPLDMSIYQFFVLAFPCYGCLLVK